MGSGEVAIVALSTMISLKVTFSDGLGGAGDKVMIMQIYPQKVSTFARETH